MIDDNMEKLVCFDTDRVERIGLTEAILANVKTPEQISEALRQAHNSKGKALITRLEVEKFEALSEQDKALLDYDPISKTAIFIRVIFNYKLYPSGAITIVNSPLELLVFILSKTSSTVPT